MSQEKAQLIAPIDSSFTVPGVTVSGVITATSFDGTITGVADSITQGKNLNVGVVTALSFAGNLTGNAGGLIGSPNTTAGVVTATSFVGDLTGNATSLTGSPNLNLGVTTASSFVGAVTGNAVGNVTGDALSATVTGITTSNNISVGVLTSTDLRGDGSNLSGVSSGEVTAQNVAITSATTSVDLSNGNLIYMNQSADTTVSFANSENGNVYIVRTKDDTTTERSITWPNSINWNGGVAPTPLNFADAADYQIFQLITRDEGVTWYGEQVYDYSTIMESSGSAWTWGVGLNGAYGLNGSKGPANVKLSSPTQIGTDTNWIAIDGTIKFGSGIKSDGTLWTWGKNTNGILGLNESLPTQRSSPCQVGTDTTWSNLSAGIDAYTIVATKTDGTFWAWGNNEFGQLGQSSTVDQSSPIQVGTDTTWTDKISAGTEQSWGIKTDGTLWGWGFNEGPAPTFTALGTSPGNVERSSPTQIGTKTDWVFVKAGKKCCAGIRDTDKGFVWGDGLLGRLGVNNKTDYSSPKQIPGSWKTISLAITVSNPAGSGGVKADGTLWRWGSNLGGQLGQDGDISPNSNNVRRSSPVQVGTDTNWSGVHGSDTYANVIATKTDGTLWSWGYNSFGELGHNNRKPTMYDSPKQVPGTKWTTKYSRTQFALKEMNGVQNIVYILKNGE